MIFDQPDYPFRGAFRRAFAGLSRILKNKHKIFAIKKRQGFADNPHIYYITLHYITLHYMTLHYIILYYIILYYIIL